LPVGFIVGHGALEEMSRAEVLMEKCEVPEAQIGGFDLHVSVETFCGRSTRFASQQADAKRYLMAYVFDYS
jgi:hypothetical protein